MAEKPQRYEYPWANLPAAMLITIGMCCGVYAWIVNVWFVVPAAFVLSVGCGLAAYTEKETKEWKEWQLRRKAEAENVARKAAIEAAIEGERLERERRLRAEEAKKREIKAFVEAILAEKGAVIDASDLDAQFKKWDENKDKKV